MRLKNKQDGLTIQINLSPGDAEIAHHTVPAIIAACNLYDEIIIIVDCVKAQSTKLFDAEARLIEPIFTSNLKKICDFAEMLKFTRVVTEVYYLNSNMHDYMQFLANKFLGTDYYYSHGYGGTGNMSYWMGIDMAKYRYVLHFDGDLIISQNSNWVYETISNMSLSENYIFGAPRHAVPIENDFQNISKHEGIQLTDHISFWTHNWFSTRCFILDQVKLDRYLPLIKGSLNVELFLRRLIKKDFRFDPEIVFYKRLGNEKGVRKVINKESAYYMHPFSKPPELIKYLGRIINSYGLGLIPNEQQGDPELNLDAWINYLDSKEIIPSNNFSF